MPLQIKSDLTPDEFQEICIKAIIFGIYVGFLSGITITLMVTRIF